MSLVIISAFLRMLRDGEDEEITWGELWIKFARLTVFFFLGMGICRGMNLLIAACS